MCACLDIFEDDFFEIPTVNTLIIEKHVIPVKGQVLIDAQCPRQIRAAITDENGLFDAPHVRLLLNVLKALYRKNKVKT
jgi:hypothetical protein